MTFLVGLGVGGFSGIIFSLLYFSYDKSWKVFGSSSGPGIAFSFVLKLLGKDDIIQYLLGYFTMLPLAIIILFALLNSYLKKNGINSSLVYFFFEKDSLKKLINKHTSLEELREELTKKGEDLNMREGVCKQKENFIKNSNKDVTCIDLPQKVSVPVYELILQEMPTLIRSLSKFCNCMDRIILEYIETQNGDKKGIDMKQEGFLGLLEKFCECMVDHFFVSPEVRIHFNKLTNNSYESIIVYNEGEKEDVKLKRIDKDKGIIGLASKNKCSIIKSLNSKHHIKGKNDSKWSEYMVIAFDKIPSLYMCIDVKNLYKYKNVLLFLNYCKIEEIIQEYLIQIDKSLNIEELLDQLAA